MNIVFLGLINPPQEQRGYNFRSPTPGHSSRDRDVSPGRAEAHSEPRSPNRSYGARAGYRKVSPGREKAGGGSDAAGGRSPERVGRARLFSAGGQNGRRRAGGAGPAVRPFLTHHVRPRPDSAASLPPPEPGPTSCPRPATALRPDGHACLNRRGRFPGAAGPAPPPRPKLLPRAPARPAPRPRPRLAPSPAPALPPAHSHPRPGSHVPSSAPMPRPTPGPHVPSSAPARPPAPSLAPGPDSASQAPPPRPKLRPREPAHSAPQALLPRPQLRPRAPRPAPRPRPRPPRNPPG
ncbi:vegetative cell wall protein gp1-like [Cervus elaphus]|uniref:vegetative cell wall protein gp1-like n=1 Tax=Cervus elaphus TaxID=9860 RepID=UPI001CC32F54|nr:vegetative cell wall protein gp1-like [Cervus elaphus]